MDLKTIQNKITDIQRQLKQLQKSRSASIINAQSGNNKLASINAQVHNIKKTYLEKTRSISLNRLRTRNSTNERSQRTSRQRQRNNNKFINKPKSLVTAAQSTVSPNAITRQQLQYHNKMLKDYRVLKYGEMLNPYRQVQNIMDAVPKQTQEVLEERQIYNIYKIAPKPQRSITPLLSKPNLATKLNTEGELNCLASLKQFIFLGREFYIRRALKRRGWAQQVIPNSQFWDLKWIVTDKDSDYQELQKGQLINHFKNNRNLTTKSGLCKCLQNGQYKIDEFFPQCYDLSSNILEFQEDYNKVAILSIIQKHFQLFQSQQFSYIDTELLQASLDICANWIQKDLSWIDLSAQVDTSLLIKYSMQVPPFQGYLRTLSNPDDNIVAQTVKVHEQLTKVFPQYFSQGSNNIWIVKPGNSSKGQGIWCSNNLGDILISSSGMCNRVAQKYIERPFLLEVEGNFVKFDIRQWVLVKSFNPLMAFVFGNNYLRLCTKQYDINNLQDLFCHLSNFSIQKSAKNKTNVQQSSKFFNLLTISQQSNILEKIYKIITKTLISVQEVIEQSPNCFELYGFDILIDEILNPWLLEVNLSPACHERTQWLTKMVDKMADGLFDVLFNEIQEQNPIFDINLNPLPNQQFELQNKWILLYKGDYYPQIVNSEAFLVRGQKINGNSVVKIDEAFKKNQAAILIQKTFRRYKKIRQMLLNKLSSLNFYGRAQSIPRNEIVAQKLLDIDDHFIPQEDLCPEAFKKYQILEKEKEEQQKKSGLLFFRRILLSFCAATGITLYSYQQRLNKRQNIMDIPDEKAYEVLTAQQLQEREQEAYQTQQFNSVLNKLQGQLQDQYQETLKEFQNFVKEKKS